MAPLDFRVSLLTYLAWSFTRQDIENIKKFLEVFDASNHLTPESDLATTLAQAEPEFAHYHILFVETIFLFALSANAKQSTDPKASNRNCKLIQTQILRVKNGENHMSESMVQTALFSKAEEIVNVWEASKAKSKN